MIPEKPSSLKSAVVPSSRFGRLVRLGSMAGGVAGNILIAGAQQLARGKRPKISDLLLTPANATKITQQLSQMRGAAMKVGQLISMDAGDLIPPEIAAILGRLRSSAHNMPDRQVKAVLSANWGAKWQQRFESFSMVPIAAASIGQVHRAKTIEGLDLAIKIQYPGVRKSINSDVDNVAALLRISGLLPKALDIAPLLKAAKRQLHEEADYQTEGAHLQRFGQLLAEDARFVVPALHADLTRKNVLAMSYVSGVAVELIENAPQSKRDAMISALFDLVYRELFEFGLMQTDPNFANYRYDPQTQQVILLDFGATRSFDPKFGRAYKNLMSATMAQDRDAMAQAGLDIGYFDSRTEPRHVAAVLELFEMALEPVCFDGAFDFGETDMAQRLRQAGVALSLEEDFWHVPPIDTLFLHRKLGGLFLLAARLKARVNIRQLVLPHLAAAPAMTRANTPAGIVKLTPAAETSLDSPSTLASHHKHGLT